MRKLRTGTAVISMMLISVGGLTLHAQRGQGGPPRPVVKEHTLNLDANEVRFPLPPGETAYGRIDGDHIKQYVNEITAISRKDRDSGNKFWGRVPGTPAEKEVQELVAAKFRAWGLEDVHMQPVPLGPQWMATDWELTATGSGKTLAFKTAYPTTGATSTPQAGVDLDVVWVGNASELDFVGRDVKGKMAFIQSMPWPNGFQHTSRFNGGMDRAVANGAAGVVVNVAISGNITQSINGPANVPGFTIGTDDAEELRALMQKGPVKVHARLAADRRTGLADANVWGTLPGMTSEEIMVIAAHDAKFEGAFSNASGTATMLGLAEYFAKVPKVNRKRTLKFVSLTNPGGQLIHDNKATLLANTVLIINCQHTSAMQFNQQGPPDDAKYPDQGRLRKTAAVNPRQWWVYGSDKLASIMFDSVKKFGIALWDDAMWEGGNLGAMSRDVPTIQTIVTPVYFTSDYDRPDVVPPSGLEAVGRAYAKIIDQVNGLSREQLVQAP